MGLFIQNTRTGDKKFTFSKKNQELEEAKEKILRAAQQQKVVNVGMTSNMKFLNTIYILSRSGDTYGTYVS